MCSTIFFLSFLYRRVLFSVSRHIHTEAPAKCDLCPSLSCTYNDIYYILTKPKCWFPFSIFISFPVRAQTLTGNGSHTEMCKPTNNCSNTKVQCQIGFKNILNDLQNTNIAVYLVYLLETVVNDASLILECVAKRSLLALCNAFPLNSKSLSPNRPKHRSILPGCPLLPYKSTAASLTLRH